MRTRKVVLLGLAATGLVATLVSSPSLAQKSASAKGGAVKAAKPATANTAAAKTSDKPFEGVISMIMRIPGDSTAKETTVYLKDKQMMMDIDMGVHGGLKIYPQPEDRKAYIAMMQSKRGQIVPLPDPNDQSADLSTFKAAGKKKTINGHKAEAYTVSNPQVEYTFWEIKDLPANVRTMYASALPHLMQEDPTVRGVVNKMLDQKMVPVEIDIHILAYDATASMQFVKSKEQPVENSVFELPKGIEFAPPPVQNPAGADSTASPAH